MGQNSFYKKFDHINFVYLSGTLKQMGYKYGSFMHVQMKEVLNILISDFAKHDISYQEMLKEAEIFYQRYSPTYKVFIESMAVGAELSLDDSKILLAMETLSFMKNEKLIEDNVISRCAFLFLPTEKTLTSGPLIGRNYDFPPPFDQAAKYLTVTVLNVQDKLPVAIISMPGQIYCPSCINSKGILIELNNGMPSGGGKIYTDRESLLSKLLEISQSSENFEDIDMQMHSINSDYSLVINAANKDDVKSYEFSSELGMKPYNLEKSDVFASTNFFQNKTWANIPVPSDDTTWYGVTRKNNLENLGNETEQCDYLCFKEIMDKKISKGGAVWDLTIYQMIFNPTNFDLLLKVNALSDDWTLIKLGDYLNSSEFFSYAEDIYTL